MPDMAEAEGPLLQADDNESGSEKLKESSEKDNSIENTTVGVPACVTTYEEIEMADSSSESEESSDDDEEIRFERRRGECGGEHSGLKRLGQKMKESVMSIKSRERKISIKSVKVRLNFLTTSSL